MAKDLYRLGVKYVVQILRRKLAMIVVLVMAPSKGGRGRRRWYGSVMASHLRVNMCKRPPAGSREIIFFWKM